MATPKEMLRAYDAAERKKQKRRPKMRHYVDSETGKSWREPHVFRISNEWCPDKLVWNRHRAFLYDMEELQQRKQIGKGLTWYRWFVPKRLVEDEIVLPGDLVAASWRMGYTEPWGDHYVSWPKNLLVGELVEWYGHEGELQRPEFRMLVRDEAAPVTLSEALKRAE